MPAMNASLKDRIQDDTKVAMRARDSARLGILRLVLAAIKQREIDERIELDEEQILAVLGKMIKQRHDSIEQFRAAGRQDLVDKENFELTLIQAYLPPALNESELEELIDRAITESDAQSMRDMGKVMAVLKPWVQGRADVGAVSARVKARLTGP